MITTKFYHETGEFDMPKAMCSGITSVINIEQYHPTGLQYNLQLDP